MRLLAQLEEDYRRARFQEYNRISRNMAIAGAFLVLALWSRDFLHDPIGAHATMGLRLVMACSALLYACALWLGVSRRFALASGYAAVFTVEFAVMEIWGRLSADPAASFPGYLYIYLILPVLLLPFSFRETIFALVLVPLVPNAQALAGMSPHFPLLAFNALIWPACAIALYVHREYERLLRRLFDSQAKLKDLATRDELTGLGNRRHLMERGREAFKLARRHARPLSVLLLDIDHFKAVNDRHGHAAGDDVLRFLGATVALQIRDTDVAGRLGGEEFALVLTETSLEDAAVTAERIREAVARTPVPSDEAREIIPVAVSIGAAALNADCDSLEALIARADEALYEAKRGGRNRVCLAGAGLTGGERAAA